MTYFLSGGYIEDQGIVIDNKFRRLNLRTNLDFKINKMVKTGIITNFSNINNKTVNLGTAYNNAYRAALLEKIESLGAINQGLQDYVDGKVFSHTEIKDFLSEKKK